MSDVEILREAAALMRKRASDPAVPETAWYVDGEDVLAPDPAMPRFPWDVARGTAGQEVADHIASWHPAVALAVADWLERVEWLMEHGSVGPRMVDSAVDVARTYLGRES